MVVVCMDPVEHMLAGREGNHSVAVGIRMEKLMGE